jgi:hypothetical protein
MTVRNQMKSSNHNFGTPALQDYFSKRKKLNAGKHLSPRRRSTQHRRPRIVILHVSQQRRGRLSVQRFGRQLHLVPIQKARSDRRPEANSLIAGAFGASGCVPRIVHRTLLCRWRCGRLQRGENRWCCIFCWEVVAYGYFLCAEDLVVEHGEGVAVGGYGGGLGDCYAGEEVDDCCAGVCAVKKAWVVGVERRVGGWIVWRCCGLVMS